MKEGPTCRIVKVWASDGDMFHGAYGSAPVVIGKPACQLNTGEIVAL